MRSIRCTGKCKQDKPVMLFAPAEVKSKRPICRACRKAYAKKYAWSPQIPSANWRQQASTLCPGSANAMERGKAA